MKTARLFLAPLALLLSSGAAMAEPANWLKPYLVGSFGSAEVDVNTTPGLKSDTQDRAYSAGVGLKLGTLTAVELSGTNVGRYTLDGTKVQASGFQIGPVVKLPLNMIYAGEAARELTNLYDKTSLFLRIDLTSLTVRPSAGSDERSTQAAYTFGVEAELDRGFSVRGQFQRYKTKYSGNTSDIDVFGVALLKDL